MAQPPVSGRGGFSDQAQIDLIQDELDPESHSVREALSRLDLPYISRGISKSAPLTKKRLKSLGGSGRVPFLRDRRNGVKLEGRDAILSYLAKEFGERAYGKRSGMPLLQGSEWMKRLGRSLGNRREDFRWRMLTPVDDAKLVALDWKRAIQTTYDSARDLVQVVRSFVQDVSQDLKQDRSRAVPVKLASSQEGRSSHSDSKESEPKQQAA